LTRALPCNTSDTVDFDTPARAATSVIVGRRFILPLLPVDAVQRQ
jgi:hypothetical protein